VATDVLAQKYFRKAGVPTRLKKIEENDVPSFLWRSVPDDAALKNLRKDDQTGSEIDARQVFDRLVTGVSSGDVFPVSCGDGG
ncbi:hypothetical protein, partial [Rhizobium johnstonii]|uniref:hypothetical protein n=1 Tax=Rhizobium johnstonii TaxID=3019933 RepID=UPI003F963DBE